MTITPSTPTKQPPATSVLGVRTPPFCDGGVIRGKLGRWPNRLLRLFCAIVRLISWVTTPFFLLYHARSRIVFEHQLTPLVPTPSVCSSCLPPSTLLHIQSQRFLLLFDPSSHRLYSANMSHTYEFNVTMTCGGCSGAIDRVLGKLEGTFPV